MQLHKPPPLHFHTSGVCGVAPQPRCHPASPSNTAQHTQGLGWDLTCWARRSQVLQKKSKPFPKPKSGFPPAHLYQPLFCIPPDGNSSHQRQECHLRDVVLFLSEINSLKHSSLGPRKTFSILIFLPLFLLVSQPFHSTFIMLSKLQGPHHSRLPTCPSSLMEMLNRKETRQSCRSLSWKWQGRGMSSPSPFSLHPATLQGQFMGIYRNQSSCD